MSTTQMRSQQIYVSPSTYRWLKLITASSGEDKATADATADQLLREAILAKHPNIETIEGDYWRQRKALDKEAAGKLTTP